MSLTGPASPKTGDISASGTGRPGGDPKLSAFLSHDTDPADRRGDRLLASLGLLEDAPPLFGCGQAIPRAGVLLAVPALVRSGVFRCAQKIYGSIGPAFYGLRTSLLTLLLMALWRIKRPEGLKEYSPENLGRVLGLDRAPEVKTLRRKLSRLSHAGKAAQFGRALAEERVAAHGQARKVSHTCIAAVVRPRLLRARHLEPTIQSAALSRDAATEAVDP
ncbi:MAG: putative transposase [Verrucomicrobiia bacterium]